MNPSRRVAAVCLLIWATAAAGCGTSIGVFEAPAAPSAVEQWLERGRTEPEAASDLGWALWLDSNDSVAARDWFRESAVRSRAARLGAADVAFWTAWPDEAARRWSEILATEEPWLARVAAARLDALLDRTALAATLGLDAAQRRLAQPATSASVRLHLDRLRPSWTWRAQGVPAAPQHAIADWHVWGPVEPGLWSGLDSPVDEVRAGARRSGQSQARRADAPLGRFVAHPHATGTFLAESRVEVDRSGAVRLALTSSAAAILYVDGAPVLERRPDRAYPAEQLETTVEWAAGTHRVELVVATASVQDDAMVQWAHEDTPPAPGPSLEPIPAALRAWLEAASSLHRGDPHAAASDIAPLRSRAPDWGPGLAMAGLIERANPAATAGEAEAAQRGWLRRALDADAGLAPAAVELMDQALMSGELDRARELLERTEAYAARGSATPRAELSSAMLARKGELLAREGLEIDAERAWEDALALHPGQCAALVPLSERAWRRPTLDAILAERAERLASCPQTRDWSIAAARRRGQTAQALEWVRTARGLRPSDESLFRIEIETLSSLSRYDDAQREVAERSRQYPRHGRYQLRSGELASRAGRATAAEATWAALVREPHLDADAHRKLALLGYLEPHWSAVALGDDQIARAISEAFDRFDGQGDSTATLIDDEIDIYLADGTVARRTRSLVQLRSERAVEALGEVRVPAGADILWVRAHKPDGSHSEPEDIAEKDTLSIVGLEVGDILDLAFLEFVPPDPRGAPTQTQSRFLFATTDGPTHFARLAVIRDQRQGVSTQVSEGAMSARIEREPLSSLPDGFVGEQFVARDVPTFAEEPFGWNPVGQAPQVAVWSAEWGDLSARWTDQLRRSVRLPPDLTRRLDELAAQAAEREEGPRWLARRVYRMIRAEVTESAGAFAWLPAERTWNEKQGERALLLHAALSRVGLQSDFALANRLEIAGGVEDAPPDDAWYGHPLVRVELPSGARWLDLTTGDLPFGYIAPAVQDRPAWVVAAKVANPTRTPALDMDLDRRNIHLRVELQENGELKGTWTDELRGITALYYREFLLAASQKDASAALRKLVEQSVAGARITSYSVEHLREPDEPLGLVLEWAAPAPSSTTPNATTAPIRLLPMQLQQQYAGLKERVTPMLLDIHSDVKFTAEIRWPAAWSLTAVPSAARIDDPLTQYALEAKQRTPDTLVLTKDWTWRLRPIKPQDYARFGRLAAQIDQADAPILEWTRR